MNEKLIAALELVSSNLKKNTVVYNWRKQESCNCGLVAQALLKCDRPTLNYRLNGIFNKKIFADIFLIPETDVSLTWTSAIKVYCPMTGLPAAIIFRELFDAGLSKEDIWHLEYLRDPEILSKAGIKTTKTEIQSFIVGKETITTKRFLIKDLVQEVVKTELREVEVPDKNYYQEKENLIKYLDAWVAILKEKNISPSTLIGVSDDLSIDELEQLEKLAAGSGDFEMAAKLRDQITTKRTVQLAY